MKKTFAVVFILVATILAIVCVFQIPTLVRVTSWAFKGSVSEIAYMFGTFLSFSITIGLIYLLYKYAFKWLRKSTLFHNTDVLDGHLRDDAS